MSYSTINSMTRSNGLRERVTAAVAGEPNFVGDPNQWVQINLLRVAAHDSTWADAWEYAAATMTVNSNPDIGARDDVINDGMILAAVQVILASTHPTPVTEA